MNNRILFQFNIAKMRTSFNDPLFDDFRAWLRALHALAEADPGFVWRYQGEKSEAGYIQPYPNDPLLMGNLSAWKNYDSLCRYVFRDGHLEILKSKRKWFEKMPTVYSVLYYGGMSDLERPNHELLEQAKDKLGQYRVCGETPAAFGFGTHRGKL
jgi:hypothetical protein